MGTSSKGDSMTDIYYCLSDGTHTLYFIPNGMTDTMTRDVWEQALPFVQAKWLMDQVTVSEEVAQQFVIKPGTGRPYSDMKTAISAIKSLLPDERITGYTLKGGDWNGSLWVENTGYPALGTGDSKILAATVAYTTASGENFTNGDITGTLNLKIGMIF